MPSRVERKFWISSFKNKIRMELKLCDWWILILMSVKFLNVKFTRENFPKLFTLCLHPMRKTFDEQNDEWVQEFSTISVKFNEWKWFLKESFRLLLCSFCMVNGSPESFVGEFDFLQLHKIFTRLLGKWKKYFAPLLWAFFVLSKNADYLSFTNIPQK